MSKWSRKLKTSSINPIIDGENSEKNYEKEVLSLSMKFLSPNQIARYFEEIRTEQMKPHHIRLILLKYQTKVEQINKKFDRIASQSISLVEMDETFKGRTYIVLVVMDSITGYIFLVERIFRKNESSIKKTLQPLANLLKNVKVVLTDGALYFPNVVRDLCPDAIHQICLVHVMRGLNKELVKLRKPYAEKLDKCNKARKKLATEKELLQSRYSMLRKLKQQDKYHRDKRNRYYRIHGVKKSQKNIRTKYPIFMEIYNRINHISSQIRSLTNSILSTKTRIKSLIVDYNETKLNSDRIWNLYMVECRVLRDFYNLFLYHGPNYEQRRERFLRLHELQPINAMRDKICNLLHQVPSLDALNRKLTSFPLKRNFQNTNGIESFNSRFRPVLESLRNAAFSTLTRVRFNLFRLYINTSTPFHPTRSDCSPIECYGYNLRGRNTFDLILDGLPPGSQSKLILHEKIHQLTRRKMVKNPKIECMARIG